MAEGLFRHATGGRSDLRVLSAGVGAMEGAPASDHAVRALKELGIDISHHRSRMLTATQGRAIMHHVFEDYEEMRGSVPQRGDRRRATARFHSYRR